MEDIDFDNPSDSLHPLHLALNDLDNVITDYDYYDPMTFYDIADRIEKVMEDTPSGGRLNRVCKLIRHY